MSESSLPPEGTEVELIVLSFWDKVIIIAGAVGFLLLLSLFLACILCPHCIFHGLCCDESDEKKKGKRKIGMFHICLAFLGRGSALRNVPFKN